MDKKSDKRLGELTYPLKNLLSAPNMVVDRYFELKNADTSCQIQMRIALRVSKTWDYVKPQGGNSDNFIHT